MAALGICLEKKVSELFKIRETCCLNDIPALYKSALLYIVHTISYTSLTLIIGVSILAKLNLKSKDFQTSKFKRDKMKKLEIVKFLLGYICSFFGL